LTKSKNEIIDQFEKHILWLEHLKEMDEQVFFSRMAPEKWSVAALVSHFKSWDEFVLTSRVPLFSGELDKGEKGPDQEEVNKKAEQYAHSGVTQPVLIDEVIATRREFVQTLKSLPDEVWEKTFVLGDSKVSLTYYITDLIAHDEHHQKQVASL
jgi:hypothetical protein